MGVTSLEETVKYLAKKRNNSHFMLVDGMSQLMTEKVKMCTSLDFHAFGLKWRFNIRSGVEEDYLSFYLHIIDEKCSGSKWEVNCTYKLGIVSQTAATDIIMPFEMDFDSDRTSWGESEIISIESLRKACVVNDKAVFYAEITGVKPRSLKVSSIPRTNGTAERLTLIETNNNRFSWKVTRFSSINSQVHMSYEFTFGPRRWYLQMYPKGCGEGKGNSFSLFLHASDFVSNVPAKVTKATFILRVLDQHMRKQHYEYDADGVFDGKEDAWGSQTFLALEKLHNPSNGLLLNDKIHIVIEFLTLSTQDYL
ncbi:unnamed protein product [Eruca vesicaria subsp. sativa]|uniref:MATH domain-containing protein n=1 Tax=Eruca vesicaria subsp. sativa TaxID=29727 RepID=A0ABC8KT87_ERUVS|nr:unnamed protein product [Eruca vesicaria subsp. sativa]